MSFAQTIGTSFFFLSILVEDPKGKLWMEKGVKLLLLKEKLSKKDSNKKWGQYCVPKNHSL